MHRLQPFGSWCLQTTRETPRATPDFQSRSRSGNTDPRTYRPLVDKLYGLNDISMGMCWACFFTFGFSFFFLFGAVDCMYWCFKKVLVLHIKPLQSSNSLTSWDSDRVVHNRCLTMQSLRKSTIDTQGRDPRMIRKQS